MTELVEGSSWTSRRASIWGGSNLPFRDGCPGLLYDNIRAVKWNLSAAAASGITITPDFSEEENPSWSVTMTHRCARAVTNI